MRAEIRDGGDAGPLFVITNPNDPSDPVVARSCSAAWSELNERVVEAKRRARCSDTKSTRVPSGPDLFGLNYSVGHLCVTRMCRSCAAYRSARRQPP